jgi:hypothetical protein
LCVSDHGRVHALLIVEDGGTQFGGQAKSVLTRAIRSSFLPAFRHEVNGREIFPHIQQFRLACIATNGKPCFVNAPQLTKQVASSHT